MLGRATDKVIAVVEFPLTPVDCRGWRAGERMALVDLEWGRGGPSAPGTDRQRIHETNEGPPELGGLFISSLLWKMRMTHTIPVIPTRGRQAREESGVGKRAPHSNGIFTLRRAQRPMPDAGLSVAAFPVDDVL